MTMALPPVFDKLRLPVVGAPQFIIANPELVIAQCKAGVVGSFPALNARPQPALEDWLIRAFATSSPRTMKNILTPRQRRSQ
jgi:nitronate monooxygenase